MKTSPHFEHLGGSVEILPSWGDAIFCYIDVEELGRGRRSSSLEKLWVWNPAFRYLAAFMLVLNFTYIKTASSINLTVTCHL